MHTIFFFLFYSFIPFTHSNVYSPFDCIHSSAARNDKIDSSQNAFESNPIRRQLHVKHFEFFVARLVAHTMHKYTYACAHVHIESHTKCQNDSARCPIYFELFEKKKSM